MEPRNGYIMDSNISIVTSTKPYFVGVVEINNVKLLLALVVLLWGVNLERFYHDIILMWFLNLKYLVRPCSMSEVILKLIFAKLTMEGFPSVSCHIRSYLLVFVTAQPLPQAF
jgi:hypothetical protein